VLDLKEVAERCLSSFGEAGAWRERIVSTALESAWVRADPTRLCQVVTNLLDNATKFTPAGGRIEVAVRPDDGDAVLEVKDNGRGSEFVVRLPLHAAPPVARPAPSPALASAARQCLRVLVVEDYEDSRVALEVYLGLLGHSVQSAADGLRGVELAREWRPDAALVDIGLPGLSGYDVARRIRPPQAGKTCS
jgi:histidine kinase/DNA gyrase B/HSP90-like ATPase/response regulator receiver domain-containing protein